MSNDIKHNNDSGYFGRKEFETVTDRYISQIDTKYQKHRFEVIKSLIDEINLSDANCIDFGCGEGAFTEYLAKESSVVTGIEPGDKMFEAAQKRLEKYDNVNLIQGGVDCFNDIEDGSVDNFFALNVIAYLTDDEEKAFYEHAQRMIKKGGHLIIAQVNALFDMYTFNKYTIRFMKRHFSYKGEPVDVTSLLKHPALPDRQIYRASENPLNFKYKLRKYGLEESRQEFAMLHSKPPLIMENFNPDDIDVREYPDTLGWNEADRWKLMFQCSLYMSLAKRI